MTTPTPMKHAASQQGRTPSQLAAATPPVSTPFSNAAQAAFSPRGPRSSPQQVKKSPAASTLMSQQPSMGPLSFDSPSTAAAMGALGIGGSFDMGLDNVGVGSLEALGAAFATEDDKLKRLDSILNLLNQKKGFVSEAGLERLAQRIGLELLPDDQVVDGRKMRALAIAGSAIALDIVLDNNIVHSTSLAYHGSASSVSKHMDAAGKILLEDLQLRPDQSPLTKTLDKFACNFERLANLDKLSIVPGLDCHEALAGIYDSLERLHQWDVSKLREDAELSSKPDQHLSQMAMCTKHGYPVMHTRGKVGLALEYWKQLRLVTPSHENTAPFAEKNEKVWSLLLGCAPLVLGIPPVRVSDTWVSKEIVKEDPSIDGLKMSLDWQEPQEVSLPQSDDNKDAGMELLQPDLSTTRVPRVSFTVTFDPPVILPQNDWMRLYAYANVNPPNINPANDFNSRSPPQSPPTFDGLFFPIRSGTRQDPSESRTISRRREVRVFDKQRESSMRSHRNTLYIYKPIYSQEVTEMPFSHPRQLVDMLPLLRQYAFLSTLLENSFGSKTKDSSHPATKKMQDMMERTGTPVENVSTTKDSLADFTGSSGTNGANEANGGDSAIEEEQPEYADGDMNLDVILWVHPAPQLQVVFPLGHSTVNVTLRILEGGTVEIANENIVTDSDENRAAAARGKGKQLTREELGRVLEYMEDLCKWAEWIRTRLS